MFNVNVTTRSWGHVAKAWSTVSLGPYHKQMWKFWSFFSLKFDSLTLKTHFISLWRVSKMHFSCPIRGCQNKGPHWHTTSLRPTHNKSSVCLKWGQYPHCRISIHSKASRGVHKIFVTLFCATVPNIVSNGLNAFIHHSYQLWNYYSRVSDWYRQKLFKYRVFF